MANTYVMPNNGKQDTNVSTANGKLAFSIPICQLKTAAGAMFPLDLDYRSNFLKEDYETWNQEIPTGLIGSGWDINIGDAIYIEGLSPIKYGMRFQGNIYSLKQSSSSDTVTYETTVHSNLVIVFVPAENVWHVFAEDGIEYLFGKNDTFNNETGAYSPATGTYTNVSDEYTQARTLISTPNAEGIPRKASADNTICRTTESILVGANNWVGPNYNLSAATEKSSGWLLSHIYDRFDNVIAFSYIQHISNLCNEDNSKTYSIASYLYRIMVYNQNTLYEKLVFDYALKDTGEYVVDYPLLERPNGMQQKFEKLYLQNINHFINNNMIENFKFISQLVNPEGMNSTNLVKRQLIKMEFYTKDSHEVKYTPSYTFEYYTNSDGVSVGTAGFDDMHPYFNAKTGALYGNLKSITYPNGEKRRYKYAKIAMCGVSGSYFDTYPDSEEPIVMHTPFNYSIVLVKSTNKQNMKFYVYTWTVSGWNRTWLATRGYRDDYNMDRFVSYSQHIISIVTPLITGTKTWNHGAFRLNAEDGTTWDYINNLKSTLYGSEDHINVSVSDNGVAVTGWETPNAMMGKVYYAKTDDLGKTFSNTYTLNLVDLTSSSTSEYRVALYTMEDRVLVFALSLLDITNTDIQSFDTTVGGLYNDGSPLPISRLGPNINQALSFRIKYQKDGIECERRMRYAHNITKIYRLEVFGNMIAIHYLSKIEIEDYTASELKGKVTFDTKDMEWACIIMNTGEFSHFAYANCIIEAQNIEDDTGNFADNPINQSAYITSAAVSGNGAIFTFHSDATNNPEINYTYFFSYQGEDPEAAFKKQQDLDSKNYGCIMKDDTFAVFHTDIGNHVFQKTYWYYNAADNSWNKINTGSVAQPSVTYNKGAEFALQVLEYIGLAMFIVLLPFGISDVVGIVLTSLSVALMVSSYTAQTILEKSMKVSLNPACSYYGNRFMNDGATIWFRENGQDKLTAIGSGETHQPYDSLSGSDIKGTVIENKQQYGIVYNHVPFFTNQNHLYYRNLKNNVVGSAQALGIFANGFNDIYYNNDDKFYYCQQGYNHFRYKAGQSPEISSNHPYFHSVDACACLYNDLSGRLESQILTISADEFCFEISNVIMPPMNILDAFNGCNFSHVDCAMEKKDSSNKSTQFYLFCGNQYELVKFTKEHGFDVIEKGTLEDMISGFPFDQLDSAFTVDQNEYYVRNGSYVSYNSQTKTKTGEGKLGIDLLSMETKADDTSLAFTSNALSIYNKKDKMFQIKKYSRSSFNAQIDDFVVEKVDFFTDPRMGDTPSAVTYYSYLTDTSTHAPTIASAVYPFVEISCD